MSIITFSFFLLTKRRFFKSKSKVWINQLAGMIRTLMIFTFLFDQDTLELNRSVYEYPHLVLIYGYVGMFLVSIVTEFIMGSN